MTLTELRYLVALSETGHFRKAAEQCFVSQPTLSVAVKKLEDELGVALFERARNHITATPIGQRIINQARTVLREADNLVEPGRAGQGSTGHGSVGGRHLYTGALPFSPAGQRLHERAPNMPLYIEESYTASLRRKLSRGELDAIFVALPFTETDVLTREVFDEPFVVVLPQDHPLAETKTHQARRPGHRTRTADGRGPLLPRPGTGGLPGPATAITSARESGQANIEGSSLETLKLMVASGMGITVLPQLAADSARITTAASSYVRLPTRCQRGRWHWPGGPATRDRRP